VTITNDGATILNRMEVQHQVAKVGGSSFFLVFVWGSRARLVCVGAWTACAGRVRDRG